MSAHSRRLRHTKYACRSNTQPHRTFVCDKKIHTDTGQSSYVLFEQIVMNLVVLSVTDNVVLSWELCGKTHYFVHQAVYSLLSEWMKSTSGLTVPVVSCGLGLEETHYTITLLLSEKCHQNVAAILPSVIFTQPCTRESK